MQTLINALRKNAEHTEKGITFVRSDGREQAFSYRQIWERAHERACFLRDRGIKKGERIVLALPEPDDFVLTFFGALVAGAVPVPLYPPQTLARLDAYLANLSRIVEVSEAKLIVTGNRPFSSGENGAPVPEAARALFALPSVRAEEIALAPPVTSEISIDLDADDLAFLQFTSGSTSSPKGVMVTHGNLEANAHAIMFDGLRADPERDKGVSWLPLYHDMGLIGFVIAPLFAAGAGGASADDDVRAAALVVARRDSSPSGNDHLRARTSPTRWRCRARRRGSSRSGTFRACARWAAAPSPSTPPRCAPSWTSSSRRASSARPSCRRTGSPKRRWRSRLPISTSRSRPTPSTRRRCLRGRAVKAHNGSAVEIVSCGRPFPGHRVEVVDPAGRAVGERIIGEIVVGGPSVASGLLRRPRGDAGDVPRRAPLHRRPRLLRRRAPLRMRAQQRSHHPARP